LAQYAGKKHINRGRWNKEEDEKLKRLVEVHGERWDFIASHFPDRADVQCQHRWQKVVNPELVKGINYVYVGTGVSNPTRSGPSNQIRPSIPIL
jgi:Myb-like DNA-binding domain